MTTKAAPRTNGRPDPPGRDLAAGGSTPIPWCNRYTLHLVSGREVIFEARSGDVMSGEHGVYHWYAPKSKRFWPYASIESMTVEKVGWREVS